MNALTQKKIIWLPRWDETVFSSLLAESHHPVRCRHHRFLVTIVTTDHRKRHNIPPEPEKPQFRGSCSNDPLCWLQHWIIAFLPRTGEIFYIVRCQKLLTFSRKPYFIIYINVCKRWLSSLTFSKHWQKFSQKKHCQYKIVVPLKIECLIKLCHQ